MRSVGARGFTMVEVAIVAVILAALLLGAVSFMRGAGNAYESMSQDTELNFNLRRAVGRMADEIRRAGVDHVTINTGGAWYDSVDFMVPVEVQTGAVTWGAENHEGWTVRLLVEDETLIRRVVDGTGTIMVMDQVLATNVDQLRDGVKGFSASINGDLLTLTLRLSTRERQRQWQRELTTSVSLRN